jgi:hypothetical protein
MHGVLNQDCTEANQDDRKQVGSCLILPLLSLPYIQKIEKPVEFFEAELESGIFTHYL